MISNTLVDFIRNPPESFKPNLTSVILVTNVRPDYRLEGIFGISDLNNPYPDNFTYHVTSNLPGNFNFRSSNQGLVKT